MRSRSCSSDHPQGVLEWVPPADPDANGGPLQRAPAVGGAEELESITQFRRVGLDVGPDPRLVVRVVRDLALKWLVEVFLGSTTGGSRCWRGRWPAGWPRRPGRG